MQFRESQYVKTYCNGRIVSGDVSDVQNSHTVSCSMDVYTPKLKIWTHTSNSSLFCSSNILSNLSPVTVLLLLSLSLPAPPKFIHITSRILSKYQVLCIPVPLFSHIHKQKQILFTHRFNIFFTEVFQTFYTRCISQYYPI